MRNPAADAKLATALRNPEAVDAALVIEAIRDGAHTEFSIPYNDTMDVTPLVMAALLRKPDGTFPYAYRHQILTNLLDRGANAGDAATRILMLTIEAIEAMDTDEVRRLVQAQHTLAIALATHAEAAVRRVEDAPNATPGRG